MREAAFRYTVPIEKAEERADGTLVLVGLASGPEVDGHGDRVAPEAIWNFAKQINESPGTIPFRDAHHEDGVFRDLGYVTKAWVTDSGYLGVEVQLDGENPAATYLHKQIQKGKQYGMSVAGKVTDWAMEYAPEIGKSLRTFRNVVLKEISATTRPSWSHSLGTVIAKAIQDAENSESDATVGESVEDELQTEQETTEAPAVNESTEVAEAATTETAEAVAEATATEEAEAATGEAAVVEAAAEAPAEAESVTTEAAAEETEEPSEPDDLSAGFREALVGLNNYMTEMLTKMGVPQVQPVAVTKSVSQDENEPTLDISKALTDAMSPVLAEIEDLRKSLGEATARIEELENSSDGDTPALVEKHDLTHDEIAKALSDMDPRERLRLGLRFGLSQGR